MKIFNIKNATVFNVHLGKNGKVVTNDTLLQNSRLSHYVNNETMGVLDNYAKHKNLNIYILPMLEGTNHDLFVSVNSAQKSNKKPPINFAIKINEGNESTMRFLKELYTQVEKIANLRRK